jgi:hypothetical protein
MVVEMRRTDTELVEVKARADRTGGGRAMSSEVPSAREPFDAMAWRGAAALRRDGAHGGRRLGTAAGPVASRRRWSRGDEDCQRLGHGERGADWRQR